MAPDEISCRDEDITQGFDQCWEEAVELSLREGCGGKGSDQVEEIGGGLGYEERTDGE